MALESEKAQAETLKHNSKTAERQRLQYDVVLRDLSMHTDGSTGRLLLDGASLTLLRGRKYALVGRNGAGKSTLLRHLATHRIVGIPDHLRIVLVDDGSQFASSDTEIGEQCALHYLLAQHRERIHAMQELVTALEATDIDLDDLDDIVRRLRDLKSDAAESRATRILLGLGVDPLARMATLSGGWKHRVALATALFVDADILLLDEPTNSLDLSAVAFLEQALRCFKMTVVVVSHDTAFVDNFAQSVVELHEMRLVTVDGNYTHFVQIHAQSEARRQRAHQQQENRRSQLQGIIERLRDKAARNPTAEVGGAIQSRVHQLEKRIGNACSSGKWKYGLQGPRPDAVAPEARPPVEFDLVAALDDLPDDVVTSKALLLRLEEVSHGYDETRRQVFRPLTLDLYADARIAIAGRNGSGKSTLLRIIDGSIEASAGQVTRWDGLRVGVINQHATKEISCPLTAVDWLIEQHEGLSTDEALYALASFGIEEEAAQSRPLSRFSDGQRSRALLASLQLSQPHLLALDEPTSHMDRETSEALAEALRYFKGAFVVASHDRAFLERLGTNLSLLVLDDDSELWGLSTTKTIFDYQQSLEKQRRAAEAEAAVNSRRAPKSRQAAQAGEDASSKKQPQLPAAVVCRKCGGSHFTMNCDAKPATAQQQRPGSGARGGAQPPVEPTMQPLREKATDGGRTWKVVVSQQTLRNVAKKGKQ